MNKEAILKHTTSYKDDLLERLQDPEFSRLYLETAFESYQEDGAKKTTVSREHLYDILASRHNPKLDNWLDILSALGFRVRLEPQKKHAEHALAHNE
jgi:hypothetical protein